MGDALGSTIHFSDGKDGWILAQVGEVPGAISQGRTRAEARVNVTDALRLMLAPEPDAGGGEAPVAEAPRRSSERRMCAEAAPGD